MKSDFEEWLVHFKVWLEVNGYGVQCHKGGASIPPSIRERYGCLPAEYLAFYSTFQSVINQEETAWFVLADDLSGGDENAFAYDTFEQLSLENLTVAEQENVKRHWSEHLPIYMKVGSGYEYYAIHTTSGQIVYGYEPEFEEVERVADSFGAFIRRVWLGEIRL